MNQHIEHGNDAIRASLQEELTNSFGIAADSPTIDTIMNDFDRFFNDIDITEEVETSYGERMNRLLDYLAGRC